MRRLLVLVMMTGLLGACGKAGRVRLQLEPGWQSVVLVKGAAPTVRVSNEGESAVDLEVAAAASEAGEWYSLPAGGGAFEAALPGSTRFTMTNDGDGRAKVELRAVRYKEIVVTQSPGPKP